MLVHGLYTRTVTNYFCSFSREKFESKVRIDLSNPFVSEADYLEDISIFGFGSINGTFSFY